MFFFGFGKLIYVTVLMINAIAVLSEDRFLARIGWGRTQTEPAFGASHDSTSVKARLVKLIDSVRTLMRSMSTLPSSRSLLLVLLESTLLWREP
ncbi:Yos1-domain-containing protein [Penicillium manginii]|uniref:Yos1-domain-containing protein n=1 Tax=Penicillium manginii TaxID=203109 RepID=UPI002548FB25|nr:Yos1-domain-containing protein [Penicillium manginii]KAJ5744447.1 Yos1-domain-containing protein [Penicillium manginii]